MYYEYFLSQEGQAGRQLYSPAHSHWEGGQLLFPSFFIVFKLKIVFFFFLSKTPSIFQHKAK